jgi:hypothetical protein
MKLSTQLQKTHCIGIPQQGTQGLKCNYSDSEIKVMVSLIFN